MSTNPTAAMLVIGDEILSGRTRDSNMYHLAGQLTERGITLAEVRVVADDQPAIVASVNALRAAFDHVFTSGGIGPTHDDITADAIAKAFGVAIGHDLKAVEILRAYFNELGREANEARMRMARIPAGASLIANPVSKAPGFQIGNVFVMAGVPRIMQAMMDDVVPRLAKGIVMLSRNIEFHGGEGDIAKPLGEIQARFPNVVIGSYPFQAPDGFATNLVLRSRDDAALEIAFNAVCAVATELTSQGKARGWT